MTGATTATYAALALGAVAAGTGVAGAASSASSAKEQARTQRVSDELELSSAQRASQEKLAKNLATRQAYYAATGTNTGSGSAQKLLQSETAQADKESSYIAARDSLSLANMNSQISAANSAQGFGIASSLMNFAQTGASVASMPSTTTKAPAWESYKGGV